MSDIKISQLPEVTSVATTDIGPVVASGVTSKITIQNLADALPQVNSALSASYALTASYAANAQTFPFTGSAGISGSLIVDGPINTSAGFTGNLIGTASYATTASLALAASYVATSSFSLTSSRSITASYALTASNASTSSYSLFSLSAQNSAFATTSSYSLFSVTSLSSVSSSASLNANYAINSTNAVYSINSINATNAQYAITASHALTASSADNFQVRGDLTGSNALFTGTITAQKLVVQTVTSSVVYASGSNIFGNSLTDVQQFTGSVKITGSLTVDGQVNITNLTGSLYGTSSWALNSLTSSYILEAVSASYSVTSSYALTASYASSSSLADTASFTLTSSYVENSKTASFVTSSNVFGPYGTNSILYSLTASYVILAQTASYVEVAKTASYVTLAQTASYVLQAVSSSYSLTASYSVSSSYSQNSNTASYSLQATSASYATTASYVEISQTASFVATASWANNAITASYVLNAVSSSFASTASFVTLAQTASYVQLAETASFVTLAQTASYVENSQTASFVTSSKVWGPFGSNSVLSSSYALTASYAEIAGGGAGFPFSGSAVITGSLLITNLSGSGTRILVADPTGFITSSFSLDLAQVYRFDQPTPSSTWTINHNLDSTSPIITVYDAENNVIIPENIVATTSNQLVVSFPFAETGSASVIGNLVYLSGSSATNALSASYALTASYAQIAQTASFVATASWANNAVTASYVLQAVSASFATTAATASTADNFYVRQDVTASNALFTGTITAQKLSVQYITASTEFVTGSTKFGSQLTDTHQFTGSVSITGSLLLNGTQVPAGSNSTGNVTVWKDSSTITGSNNLYWDLTNSRLGIGTTTPLYRLHVKGDYALIGQYNLALGASLPSSSADGGVAVAWNRSGGGAETDFINLYENAFTGFEFSQKTGSNAVRILYRLGSSYHSFYTNDVVRAQIDNFGNFGIGTSPDGNYILQVKGGFSLIGQHNTSNLASSSAQGGVAFSWNRSGGRAETNITNVYDNSVTSFEFLQKTGANTVNRLYQIQSTQHSFYVGDSIRMIVFESGSQVTGSLNVSGGITGSLFGTSSLAQNSITASYVQTAQTASYVTGSIYNSNNPALSSSYAITASYAVNAGGGAGFPFSGSAVITGSLLITNLSGSGNRLLMATDTGFITASTAPFSGSIGYVHSQSSAASTWSVTHNLDTLYPLVTVFSPSNTVVIPNSITVTGANTLDIGFLSSISGLASIVDPTTNYTAAVFEDAPVYRYVQSTAASTWTINHNLNSTSPIVTVYDGANRVMIPQEITATTANQLSITFVTPESGSASVVGNLVFLSGSNSVTASYAFTASYALNAANLTTYQLATGSVTASLNVNSASFQLVSGSTNLLFVSNSGLITAQRLLLSSSQNMSSGSTLVVFGSGSAQPVFTVQGSQGELFSVNDSLSGSLFSVNDISGLPIIEAFSDNRVLIGSYQAPMLTTTVRTTLTVGNNMIYQNVPTASYDAVFFEYSLKSGSNARAGSIMGIWSGSDANYTEVVTTDFGDTTGVKFMVMVTGSNVALTGSATTGNWTMKTIVRGI